MQEKLSARHPKQGNPLGGLARNTSSGGAADRGHNRDLRSEVAAEGFAKTSYIAWYDPDPIPSLAPAPGRYSALIIS